MDILNYKGYEGTAELDMDQGICRGKILFISDLVTYKAETPAELRKAFEEAVDDYIATCMELGREPRKPLKGSFNVRVPQELHKEAVIMAKKRNTSLNEIVKKALDAYVNSERHVYHEVTIKMSPDEDAQVKTLVATPSSGTAWITTGEINVH